jgi:HEAT repeat protein
MDLIAALKSDSDSTRLQAALAIGASPEPELVDTLVARCAVEPNFYVRDMLTWALTRLPQQITVPKLIAELSSNNPQARSQSLHTLSKIKDASTWQAIPMSLLYDSDDEVARSAWRAAVVLVPDGQRFELAGALATQFGRGDQRMQLSLSRAIVALGGEAVEPVLRDASASSKPGVRAHAAATERLMRDPSIGFQIDAQEAKRTFILSKQR